MFLRVIFDTNIYGVIQSTKFEQRIAEKLTALGGEIIVYGVSEIIRKKELRKTSDRRLRVRLLTLYDLITQDRDLTVTPEVKSLAKLYHSEYTGIRSWRELENDFLIIACASINSLDIIVSEDKRTMLSESARAAYESINKKKGFRTPRLIGYEDFKRLVG